jgi:hypothetical protein
LESAESLLNSAIGAVRAGNLDAAIALIRRAIAAEPCEPMLHFNLARCLWARGELGGALDACHAAYLLRPESLEFFDGLVHMSAGLVRAGRRAAEFESPAADASSPGPEAPSFSIIVCSIDPAKRERVRLHYESLLGGYEFEIVQIADAASLSEGYNRGLDQSTSDIVVFCHDDVEIISPDFANRLARLLGRHDVVGVAGTSKLISPIWVGAGWPHTHGCVAHDVDSGLATRFSVNCYGFETSAPIQALDGVFIAARRAVCEKIRFDQEIFDGFHLYDIDFSYRAYLAGYDVAVSWDILVKHESSGVFGEDWERYAGRFVRKSGLNSASTLNSLRQEARLRAVKPAGTLEFFDSVGHVVEFSRRLKYLLSSGQKKA